MRLLSREEVSTEKNRILTDRLRLDEKITLEINRKIKKLNILKEKEEQGIEAQKSLLNKEIFDLKTIKGNLAIEVNTLEQRKEQALIPIKDEKAQFADLRKRLEAEKKIVVEKELTITVRENNLVEKLEILEEKLDGIAERELEAKTLIEQVKKEKDFLKTSMENLSKEWEAFTVRVALKERELKTRETNIIEREKAKS